MRPWSGSWRLAAGDGQAEAGVGEVVLAEQFVDGAGEVGRPCTGAG